MYNLTSARAARKSATRPRFRRAGESSRWRSSRSGSRRARGRCWWTRSTKPRRSGYARSRSRRTRAAPAPTTLTCCIVTEELAVGDPDVAAVLAQTSTLAHALFDRLMTEEQRGRFLPAFLRSRAITSRSPSTSRIATRLSASTITGRRRAMRLSRPPRCARAIAWIVNGRKDRVANAPLAGLFAVRCTTRRTDASTLLVPRDTPGLAVRRPRRDALAPRRLRAREFAGLPRAGGESARREARFADAGRESRRIMRSISASVAPPTKPPSTTRSCAYRADAASSSIRRSAQSLPRSGPARGRARRDLAGGLGCDHPDAFADRSLPDLPLRTIAEAFASDAIYHATKDAAECFGAMGVMNDMPLQKYVHDALICLHSGAGNSDAMLRIAEALAGYRRPAAPPRSQRNEGKGTSSWISR